MPRRGGVTDHNAAMDNKAETNMATHQGHCFCAAVEIEVNGAPEAMGYCHCNACRSWSAAPVGEGLKLLENWRGASFADLIHQTGFSEPGKGAPHGDEDTRFAAHT